MGILEVCALSFAVGLVGGLGGAGGLLLAAGLYEVGRRALSRADERRRVRSGRW